MHNLGLSLISQPNYTRDTLERISDLGFSKISVTPQQLGLLDPIGFPAYERLSILEYAKSIGLEIHSIQGLFFGIDTSAKNLEFLLTQRLSKIADCASYLSIPNVVIGSPDFRKSPQSWSVLNKSLAKFEGSFSGGMHMENICTGLASCDLSENFPLDQNYSYISCMLDVSNALSCSHVSNKSFVDVVKSDFCHLAYKEHRLPQNQFEFTEILSLLDFFPQVSLFIWEIFTEDLKTTFEALRKFNAFLTKE